MLKFILGLVTAWLLLVIPTQTYANHLPPPTAHVNDFAGVLTTDQKAQLESSLNDYQQKTGNEIAVALVKSLNGDTIDNFAVRAFEEWKIGKKGKDNGLLFLAAIDDHKMRIEIGYGLEPYLTDSQAGEIIRNIIAPHFKAGDYYGGLSLGLTQIQDQISQNPVDNVKAHTKLTVWSVIKGLVEIFGGWIVYLVFLLIYLLFSYLGAFLGRSKEVWTGTIMGGVIGGLLGWFIGNTI